MSKTAKSDMPVVLFVGGYGSRIREETIDKPKPMINVGGKPILWHLMKIYNHYGYNNFILTLGYKGDYIRKFLKKKGNIFTPFNITLVETGETTPTGGRLLRAASYIKTDDFMCNYGDGLSDVDINKILKFHKSKKAIGTITSTHVPHKFGIVSISKEGLLRHYKKGHMMKESIHAGFMVLNKKYMDYLDDNMMIEDPFNNIAKAKKLAVYDHLGFFGAVDTYKDLEDMNDMWNNHPKWKVWKD